MYTSVLTEHSTSFSIGFPFALSVTILFIITMMFNPEYLMNKLQFAFQVRKKEEKEKDDGMESWKSGLIHFVVGGFIIPSLFAMFSLYFTKKLYLHFIIFTLNYLGFNVDYSIINYFSTETSIILYSMMLLFTYVGIWLGVLFSILFLRFFPIGKKYKLIRWSIAYMIGYAVLMYYINNKTRVNDFSELDFNFFDYFIRVMLFYVISKKYFYTLAKELEAIRRYI
jgi:hypothetical protein